MEGVNPAANMTAVYGCVKQACDRLLSNRGSECEQVAQATDQLWRKTWDTGSYLLEGVKSLPGAVYGLYSDLGDAPWGSGPVLQVIAIAATAWAIYDLTLRRHPETHYYNPNEVTISQTPRRP